LRRPEAFRRTWIEHQASVNQPAQPEAEPIASDGAEKEDALIEAFRRLVGQPDYEMAAIIATAHPFAINMYGVRAFGPAQSVSVILKNCANSLANGGRFEEALSAAELVVRGGLANPYPL